MILHTHSPRSPRRGSTLLSTLLVALLAVVAAATVVATLILLRIFTRGNPDYEFIYRRLEDSRYALTSWLELLAPVGYTYLVLWLILFFRQPLSLNELLSVLHFPRWLRSLLLPWAGLALAAWLLLVLIFYIALWAGADGLAFSTPFVRLTVALAPFVVYFVLISVLSLIGLCVHRPLTLIPLGVALVVAGIYAPLAYFCAPTFSWWVVLVPVLALALVYVGLMYQRDAQSVHPAWASFLGVLRCAVYATLAFIFLLPGCQNYKKTETNSKVLVLFDVSGSMGARDDRPRPGEDIRELPTRTDKVLKLLTDAYPLGAGVPKTFLQHLLDKSPVVFYRFGGSADKEPVFFTPEGTLWSKEQFAAWLKPSKADLPKIEDNDPNRETKLKARREQERQIERLLEATDIGGPALEAVNREAATANIQAVVLFSDGQRNRGGDDAVKELLLRASNPKRPIHIITVGVGEYREPVGIRLLPLRAPSGVRPDDGPFTVKVPVFGDGLQDQKFEVSLEVKRTKNRDGKPIEEKGYLLGPKPGQFKGAGDFPFDEVEFTINLEELTGIKHKEDDKGRLQGTWEFKAIVPRHPREGGAKDKHVSDPPTPVLVLDKKLRVLLFASGPSRDYQFARNQFAREVIDKRMDLSIYLQTAGLEDVDQDVDGNRLLTQFPRYLGKAPPEQKYLDLKEYDVVIAFDADWMKVKAEEMQQLKEWVAEHSGGLIVVGGPIYTDRLARPGAEDVMQTLKPLFEMLPVKLNDSVLQELKTRKPPDRSRPWPLKFSANAKSLDFLKLDDASTEPLAGWTPFFWGAKTWEYGKQPKRGFHSYHPVESIKPTAEVLATFADPDAPKIMEGKLEMPYMVALRFDKGKTFYIGSGELWRLKSFKNEYYERFLTKLVRYVSAGGQSKTIGKFSMAPEYVQGQIQVEAEVLDKDGFPLRAELKPEVQIIRPVGFDPKVDRTTPDKIALSAKKVEGRWRGIFAGQFPAETPGTYTVKIEIAGAEPFSHTFNVKAPNIELGNLRTNFDHLRSIATEAGPLLERLDLLVREDIVRALEQPKGADKDTKARLFFKLASADKIPQLLTKVPPEVNSVKDRFDDFLNMGTKFGERYETRWVLMVTFAIIGVFTGVLLLIVGRWILGLSVLGGTAVVVGVVFLADLLLEPFWLRYPLPVEMAVVLGVLVGLLSLEWLTRKLLKLA